jgi:naphthoate synthase
VDQPWVRIAFDRPEVRNAFSPHTVDELIRVLRHAADTPDVVAVLLAGNGPSPKDGGYAFCSGGDQRFRGTSGYEYARTDDAAPSPSAAGAGRLHILEAQHLIRTMAKVVIAVVDGWAAGGGHSLHVVADLTVACREHGLFTQTDATVGSFDAGYGSALLARQVGQKRARQIFFLAQTYTAEQAEAWGAINAAVDHPDVESTALGWAQLIAAQSPQAIRVLKFAFNLEDDGLAGQQMFAAEATRLAYGTEEGAEGRDAFLERREPQWAPYRKQIL